ncbi:MAG: sensory protein [Candidatus Methanoperedens nitroreducens]|uniref:Sensory protein n=1 Tax=Candidatus Methanoperedens nitratireducens TaxID=1392998 RepID=A0A0P7ZFA3_9EURY|nr:DUF2111 domain-containing protein [Candidatus Methanoperedens sp. BLZ2]KAB2941025.1 MAG: DUF2111 domain-containing protein [Candidatus Methanoperedens sp.]KPQ43440.1 MAG: sensory protein [Candidatus Methanoperedens sp. BLZ1]MBZ0174976.1 DUF2111 domain-containing protein [Candidatus Methanoperedens nitroreducens]CAG0993733.1 hypothetical protein METP2_02775 [Methanosarcinales archaeon]MCX9079536.1 DUF2111 domain-containing protein [Candidatus Methanoperedens sp.]
MSELRISENSSSDEILPFAKMVHELFSLPVTMRSKNKKGVRLEKGNLIDKDYTGPVLEEAIQKNRVIHTIPTSGEYKGIPVVVTPIQDKDGKPIAALGIVDVICTIDLASVFGNYPQIVRQVEESKKH